MTRRIAVLLAASLALAGCETEGTKPLATLDASVGTDAGQPDAGAVLPDAGPVGPDAGAPMPVVDLNAGTWKIENASNTAGTMSHHGSIAFTEDGTIWIGYTEPHPVKYSKSNIAVASKVNGVWSNEALTSDVDVQIAYPSMVSDGKAVHLVYSGYPEGTNAIYYARHDASGWTPRVNLNKAFEATEAFNNIRPSIALGPQGQLAVAYVAHPFDVATDKITGPGMVRVVRIANGVAEAAPVTVIPAPGPGADCNFVSAQFDPRGKLHVVADCGVLHASDHYYATDASGAWSMIKLPDPNNRDVGPVSLALGQDGETLHLVYLATLKCATGSGNCGEIFYRTVKNGDAGYEINVSETPDAYEESPKMALDGSGRILIAFSKENGPQGLEDVFVTWLEGGAFKPPRLLTPGTDGQIDWDVSDVRFDPATGRPHVTYMLVVPNGQFDDTEVMHAELVP